jgi:hypothetical protein
LRLKDFEKLIGAVKQIDEMVKGSSVS